LIPHHTDFPIIPGDLMVNYLTSRSQQIFDTKLHGSEQLIKASSIVVKPSELGPATFIMVVFRENLRLMVVNGYIWPLCFSV